MCGEEKIYTKYSDFMWNKKMVAMQTMKQLLQIFGRYNNNKNGRDLWLCFNNDEMRVLPHQNQLY